MLILFKSADLLVEGISRYARKLGLSDALIGLVVIAMAASAPEIISALMGFFSGDESIGFGAVLGNNMVHAALGIGIVAVLGRKIVLEPTIFTKQKLIMWAALMLPFLLALDGKLSRVDGIVLIAAFCIYIARLWKMEGKLGKLKKRVQVKHIWRDAFIFLGCLAALLLAGRWLVHSSILLSNAVGIPAYFIGLTVIGIGTTLPDLAVELKSVFKKHPSIGLGDLLGSFTIELLLFLGILSLVKPLTINPALVWNAALFLVLSISFVMYLMRGKAITWKHGLVLLGLFFLFLVIEIIKMV
jgi:cation:H+ antiporter